LLAAVARDKGRWRIVFPELDAGKFIDKFGADVPFAVIPVGQMIADGRMPMPKRINSRVVWDRRQVDSFFARTEGVPPK
jgi:hypothetical protein